MNLVLDTHTFLWIVTNDNKLSTKAKKYYLDKENDKFLSGVSIWEIAIKISMGKLKIGEPLGLFIEKHAIGNSIKILEIKHTHLYILESLPFHHKDPFDRAIIAQCIFEGYQIIGNDKAFDPYPVERVW